MITGIAESKASWPKTYLRTRSVEPERRGEREHDGREQEERRHEGAQQEISVSRTTSRTSGIDHLRCRAPRRSEVHAIR